MSISMPYALFCASKITKEQLHCYMILDWIRKEIKTNQTHKTDTVTTATSFAAALQGMNLNIAKDKLN